MELIVWRAGDVIWLTRQTDHMRQVGQIAAAWGNAVFAPATPRAPLLIAAAMHDSGWREWDERPALDTDGYPLPHFRLPPEEHPVLYRRGIETVLREDRYAGLLTSMHGSGLHLGRYGVDGDPVPDRQSLSPAAAEFVSQEEARQAELRREMGLDEAEAWRSYWQLQAWDRLAVLLGTGRPAVRLAPVPAAGGEIAVEARRLEPTVVALSPYPFTGRERVFPLRSRRLPNRPLPSAAAYRESLAAAEEEELRFTLVAGG